MTPYLLIIVLAGCHWLADFSALQRPWMLRAKAEGKPLLPIAAHAGVHALLMGVVLLCLLPLSKLPELIIFQWGTHFIIDVWKGRMNGWFPQVRNPANQVHWLVFGFDQWLHLMVIVGMVWWVFR